MQVSDPFEILPPFVHQRVSKRHSINPILLHIRVGGLAVTMEIKLFFQVCIDCLIDLKWRASGATDTRAIVEIKTAGAFHEQLNPGSTDLKRLCTSECVEPAPLYLEFLFHGNND